MTVITLPRLYSENELAAHLGVNPETLARERRRGRLPFTRVGHKIRYTQAHVDAYLQGNECRATTSSRETASGRSCGPSRTEYLDADRLALEIATQPSSRLRNGD